MYIVYTTNKTTLIMKKILRYLLYLIAAILVIVIGFAAFIQIRGIPSYEAKVFPVEIEYTPEKVLHGKKLASMLCVKCHLNSETNQLTGKFLADAPTIFGKIYSKNITHSKTKGIGNWTDAQLIYLIRTGVRPDGSYIPPYMSKLNSMADYDLESIIAWLRSDDPMLAESEIEAPDSEPSFFTKFLSTVAFGPLPYDGSPRPLPDTTNAVEHGKYIATSQLECYSCHSKDFATNNDLHHEQSAGFFGGGNPMLNYDGKVVNSANLTMDEETGIGSWTEQEFIKAVKTMQTPSGKILQYPMEPYSLLSDKEVSHIYAYLKTLPKIKNRVARYSN